MTQREFERRVKGVVDQPRRRPSRERSQPGRFGALLRAALAMLCVAVLLDLTADGSRFFALQHDASQSTAQMTEEQAVAHAVAAAAATASVADHIPHKAHHRRSAAAAHGAVHHASATAARRVSSGAVGGALAHESRLGAKIGSAAAGKPSEAAAAAMGGTVAWLQSVINSAFAPLLGREAAAGAADSFVLHLPVVAGAGAFIVVMLLCLGAGTVMSSKANRAQRVEVYR
jgi:hypothetical protein